MRICSQFRLYICYLWEFVKKLSHYTVLCGPVYIYIRQISSFRAPTLWFIDLIVTTCHIQYTFLSWFQFFYEKTGKTRKYSKSAIFGLNENGRRRLLGCKALSLREPLSKIHRFQCFSANDVILKRIYTLLLHHNLKSRWSWILNLANLSIWLLANEQVMMTFKCKWMVNSSMRDGPRWPINQHHSYSNFEVSKIVGAFSWLCYLLTIKCRFGIREPTLAHVINWHIWSQRSFGTLNDKPKVLEKSQISTFPVKWFLWNCSISTFYPFIIDFSHFKFIGNISLIVQYQHFIVFEKHSRFKTTFHRAVFAILNCIKVCQTYIVNITVPKAPLCTHQIFLHKWRFLDWYLSDMLQLVRQWHLMWIISISGSFVCCLTQKTCVRSNY